jgi:hypothetical protein
MSPKTATFKPAFQVNNKRGTDLMPIKVLTVDSDAKPGSREWELAVERAAAEMKRHDQMELEKQASC